MLSDILTRMHHVPGLVDMRIQQPLDYPTLDISVDRTKAEQGGYTTRDVSQSVLNSLSAASFADHTDVLPQLEERCQLQPCGAKSPQYKYEYTMQDLQNIPINSVIATPRTTPEELGNRRHTQARV